MQSLIKEKNSAIEAKSTALKLQSGTMQKLVDHNLHWEAKVKELKAENSEWEAEMMIIEQRYNQLKQKNDALKIGSLGRQNDPEEGSIFTTP